MTFKICFLRKEKVPLTNDCQELATQTSLSPDIINTQDNILSAAWEPSWLVVDFIYYLFIFAGKSLHSLPLGVHNESEWGWQKGPEVG